MRSGAMRRTACGAVVAVLAAGGCASIPDHGPVHTAGYDSAGQDQPLQYDYDPRGPVRGSAPEVIADDFMVAMGAQPVSSEPAREFLTASAGRRWEPAQETVVYSGFSQERVGPHRIDLTLETVATLGPRGAYTAVDEDRSVTLRMKKEKGQWRIDELPNAYFVSRRNFDTNYRPLSLCFIDKSRRFAVPQPVYLPGGDQLATNAVNSLLRGPTESLSRVADTYLPKDVGLDVSVRTRDDGSAEVRLAGSLDDLSAESRQLLSAQLVLTLRQIPGVESVELLVNGVPYEVPGVADEQDVDAWSRYDTSVASSSTPLFAVREGRLVSVEDGEVHDFARPGDAGPRPIGDFGVDAGLKRLAVVNEKGTEAYVDSISEDAESRKILDGNNILTPWWDPHGWLWLTDARSASTSIAVWRDGRLRSVPTGALEGMRTRSVAISPDGTRFAAIASEADARHPDRDAAMYVGYVHRGDDGETPVRLSGVHRVPLSGTGLHSPRSIAWRNASNLVVLAEQGPLNAQPYIVAIDGSSLSGGVEVGQPSLPDIGATSITASGRLSDPIYVGDDDGGVWQLDSNQRWSSISDAKIWRPHFPG